MKSVTMYSDHGIGQYHVCTRCWDVTETQDNLFNGS